MPAHPEKGESSMLFAFVLIFVGFLFFAGGWVWILLLFLLFAALKLVEYWTTSGSGGTAVVFPDTQKDVARRIQNLAEVSDFTEAVTALRVNTTLSAHEKLVTLAKHYSAALKRLEVAGQLTPETALEFRLFAEQSVSALTGLTADFGAGLNHLIRSYE
jgi:hypothetical protein